MSLSRYSAEARGLIEELRQSLSPEDVEDLRQYLAGIGASAWSAWKERSANHISRYAASTPSERKRRKEWADPALRRVMILAAMQHLQRGATLLSEIARTGLEPGIGYRSMAAAAGDAYARIFSQPLPDWPLGGKDPFQKGA